MNIEDVRGLDLGRAAAGRTAAGKVKMRTIASLNVNYAIDDVLITLSKQYGFIHPLTGGNGAQSLFRYSAQDHTTTSSERPERLIAN